MSEEIKQPKLVVIGGGTGNSIILKGLKYITSDICTIVAMGDNGGNTGVLREDLGMLPPGDIRACLLSLANIEPAMERVLSHRYESGALKGYSFGNLLLASMNEIYGSFEQAVIEASNILNITGRVYPMTTTNVNLVATMSDGEEIFGECEIAEYAEKNGTQIVNLHLDKEDAQPIQEALEKLDQADIIIIGPGSLYTSVIPNLRVNGIREALNKTKAKKVYACNIMTQPGETTNYKIKDHIQALFDHCDGLKLDYVIANNYIIPDNTVLKRYIKKGQQQIYITDEDIQFLKDHDIKLIEDKVLGYEKYISHDAVRVSQIINRIYSNEEAKKELEKEQKEKEDK